MVALWFGSYRCFFASSCVFGACFQQHNAAVQRVTESMATATHCRRSFSRGGQAAAGQTMRLLRACIMFLAISGFSSSFKPAFIKATRPVSKALQATTTPVIDSDAEAFERITLARRATKHFERRAVPDELLKKVLALVMRSPSGFNAQPYECVVVTSEEAKKKLSRAMLGANRERVLEAGATVVFASDLNSMKNVKKLTKLLGEEGWPEGFISKVPLYLSVFSTGHKRFFRLPLVVIKKASFAVVQRLGKGMPTVAGAETWAFKNTMLAVQELLLAATSHGLASCPMEGFDMRRLRKALRIPLRYSIPIVVCIGYPSEEQRDFKTLRFDPGEVFHRDEFGTTLEGIPSL